MPNFKDLGTENPLPTLVKAVVGKPCEQEVIMLAGSDKIY